MAVYEIPLVPTAQRFSITLAGKVYNMLVLWNGEADCWMLDIADASNVPLISGIPLVTGVDLLAQYGHLVFGGQLVVQTDNSQESAPSLVNLGTTSHLFFLVD